MDGVLVLDKPAGPTSHDVVVLARRRLRQTRIGHTGTLDPLATGVLPLVLGRATRLAALLSATDKEYLAEIRFGAATSTFDAEGRIVWNPATGQVEEIGPPPAEPAGLTAQAIERALPEFRGAFLQEPPAYSAKKIKGVRAYKQARRASGPPTLTPVLVRAGLVELQAYDRGLARIRLRTSAGFYVRAFAHHLGQRLGCGAHLERLRRTAAAGFGIQDAVPTALLDRDPGQAALRVIPMGGLLTDLPSVTLTESGARRASHGGNVHPAEVVGAAGAALQGSGSGTAAASVRLLDGSGGLLAIAERLPGGVLHPAIVLV